MSKIPEETEHERVFRCRVAFWGWLGLALAIIILVAIGSQPRSSIYDGLSTDTPAGQDSTPEELTQTDVVQEDLDEIAEHFNQDLEFQKFIPSHLWGATLEFPDDAPPEQGDGSDGWRFQCSLITEGRVWAEDCVARIYREGDNDWEIIGMEIDDDFYER